MDFISGWFRHMELLLEACTSMITVNCCLIDYKIMIVRIRSMQCRVENRFER